MRSVFGLVFVMACGGASANLQESKLSGDEGAVEAALLHEIAGGGVTPDETICVRVRGADKAAVITALQARYPNLTDGSYCSGGGFDPVKSPDGGAAVMFEVGPVKRDDTGVRVNGGGAHRGGGSAREIEYTLESAGDGYRVKSEKLLLTT